MLEKTLEVQLKTGLQARPAAQFVQEANRFSSEIFVEKEGKKVNAKSIMGIMSLAINKGCTITLTIEGNDEADAMEKLTSFIEEE
ncbi:MAG TPA: HPr family phosphocarrier protein [Chondromyces sp.]|nr:HPr family phosphocarrier protein [Chondromyces sp.]